MDDLEENDVLSTDDDKSTDDEEEDTYSDESILSPSILNTSIFLKVPTFPPLRNPSLPPKNFTTLNPSCDLPTLRGLFKCSPIFCKIY